MGICRPFRENIFPFHPGFPLARYPAADFPLPWRKLEKILSGVFIA
jgi:hypothetical protein